jgi:AhpD family alkylhydroperoxidase
VPAKTLGLVHLRASQINGCAFCVDGGVRHAKQAGETDERLHAVAAWRESPCFDEAECAALALAEAATRLADNPESVSNDIWEQAAKHYDERKLGGLVLWIALSNLYNRINVTTRQPAGSKTW